MSKTSQPLSLSLRVVHQQRLTGGGGRADSERAALSLDQEHPFWPAQACIRRATHGRRARLWGDHGCFESIFRDSNKPRRWELSVVGKEAASLGLISKEREGTGIKCYWELLIAKSWQGAFGHFCPLVLSVTAGDGWGKLHIRGLGESG